MWISEIALLKIPFFIHFYPIKENVCYFHLSFKHTSSFFNVIRKADTDKKNNSPVVLFIPYLGKLTYFKQTN